MMDGNLNVDIRCMRYPGFDTSVDTISNLSFTAPAGGFISFLGPSGAGKTTLLRIVAGLENRYEGEITLGVEPIRKPSRQIQMVFQDYRLLPWKTVARNIEFAVARSASKSRTDLIKQWIGKVGLSNKNDSWPKDLSGGEEGRVAFARTFVDPPRVLLLDEPFRNLDLATKFDLQEILLETMKTNPMTVLMVSHNINDALFLSDTIYLMSKSPMRIKETFEPQGSRPRNRNDRGLRDLEQEISERLLASNNE